MSLVLNINHKNILQISFLHLIFLFLSDTSRICVMGNGEGDGTGSKGGIRDSQGTKQNQEKQRTGSTTWKHDKRSKKER